MILQLLFKRSDTCSAVNSVFTHESSVEIMKDSLHPAGLPDRLHCSFLYMTLCHFFHCMNEAMKWKYKFILALVFILLSGVRLRAQDNLNLNLQLNKIDSTNIFISTDYYNWGSTVIKGDDGRYHMFYERWPHGKRALDDDAMNYIFDGFSGWMKYGEIAYAVSDYLAGPYHYVSTVAKGDWDPAKWDRYIMENPQIRKFGNYYYLYYISNSFDSGYTNENAKNKELLHWFKYNCTQKIGVLKAASIEDLVNGRYQKSSSYLMAPDNISTFEVTNNPSVTEGPDGRFYMMYKSRKPKGGTMTFWVAVADKPDEPFTTISKVFTEPDMACEDPVIWYDKKRKRFYAVAKYFSNSKKLAPQFGALVLITSKDGKEWSAAEHTLVSLKELKFNNGRTVQVDRLERPFIVTDKKGKPVALFAAAAVTSPVKGDPENVLPENNSFNVCIPLNASGKK